MVLNQMQKALLPAGLKTAELVLVKKLATKPTCKFSSILLAEYIMCFQPWQELFTKNSMICLSGSVAVFPSLSAWRSKAESMFPAWMLKIHHTLGRPTTEHETR